MRKEKPTGKEIAEKSKKIKLKKEEAIEFEKKGKKIKFTPAETPPLNSIEELADGLSMALIWSEILFFIFPCSVYTTSPALLNKL